MVREVSEDQIYDTIEFNEFLQMMSKQQSNSMTEDSLKDAFRIFDKDDDGFISVEELRHIMQSLGEKMSDKELDEMVLEADSDKDGLINYQEFVQVLCSEAQPLPKPPTKKSGLKKKSKGCKGSSTKDNQKCNNGDCTDPRSRIEEVVIEAVPKAGSLELSPPAPSGGGVGSGGGALALAAKALVDNVAATAALIPRSPRKAKKSSPPGGETSGDQTGSLPGCPPTNGGSGSGGVPVKPGFKGSVSASSINNNHTNAVRGVVGGVTASLLGEKVSIVVIEDRGSKDDNLVATTSCGFNNNQSRPPPQIATPLSTSSNTTHRHNCDQSGTPTGNGRVSALSHSPKSLTDSNSSMHTRKITASAK